MKSGRVTPNIQLGRRRGVNLANRHARILKSIGRDDANASNSLSRFKPNHESDHPEKKYFQGILIPQKPNPPSADECCMSNCRPCVHDIYLSALSQYKTEKVQLQNILKHRNIPMDTWPSEIQRVSNLEQQLDLAETKAIYTAQEAKRIMGTVPLANENLRDYINSGRNMLLEAGKLVFWVVKGCPG